MLGEARETHPAASEIAQTAGPTTPTSLNAALPVALACEQTIVTPLCARRFHAENRENPLRMRLFAVGPLVTLPTHTGEALYDYSCTITACAGATVKRGEHGLERPQAR
jgi:hypothetical protein